MDHAVASGVRASSAPLSQGRLQFDDRAGPRKGSSTLRPCIGTLNPPLSTPKKGTQSAAVDQVDHPLYSFAEQPKENGQKCADKQASDDREMKTEVSLAVMNIARQSAQPVFAESRPEQQTDARNNQAEDKQKFAQIIHGSTNKITLRTGFSSPAYRRCLEPANRVRSRTVARAVADKVTRRNCFSPQNPPLHVGGYHS